MMASQILHSNPKQGNLRKWRAIQSLEEALCPFCNQAEETSSHYCFPAQYSWMFGAHITNGWASRCSPQPSSAVPLAWQKQSSEEGRNSYLVSMYLDIVAGEKCSCVSKWRVLHGKEPVMELIQLRSWNWAGVKLDGFCSSLLECRMDPIPCIHSLQE